MGGLFLLLLIGFGIFEVLSAFYKRKMPDKRTLNQMGMVFIIVVAPLISALIIRSNEEALKFFITSNVYINIAIDVTILCGVWFGVALAYTGFQKLLILRCTPKEEGSTDL